MEHSARGAAARGATRRRPHGVVTGVCGIRRRLSLVFLGFRHETVTVRVPMDYLILKLSLFRT